MGIERAPQARGNFLTIQERKIYDLLRARRGEMVSANDLIRELYPEPDFEPEHAYGVVGTILHRLRRKGIAIDTISGWRLPG